METVRNLDLVHAEKVRERPGYAGRSTCPGRYSLVEALVAVDRGPVLLHPRVERRRCPSSRMYFSSPDLTICASWATVGELSWPLKPPIVTTALPVWMMIGAVVCEPVAATRYFAAPWCF